MSRRPPLRRSRRSQSDDGIEFLTPRSVNRFRKGEFGHIAEAAVADNQFGLAESLCVGLRPWARERVLGRGEAFSS